MVMSIPPATPAAPWWSAKEFEKIFKLTSERGIYLMTDECYCEILYDSQPFSIASLPGAKDTCWWRVRFRRPMP